MPAAARGRPRSESRRRAILSAAAELYAQRGYDGLSMVAIAARADVGKQTVYRWWRTKAAVLAECVVEGIIRVTPVVAQPSGDVRADLRAWLRESYARLSEPGAAELFRALNAAAVTAPEAARAIEERFTAPLRAALLETLNAGRTAGAIRADLDLEALADLLLARIMFAVVSGESSHAAVADDVVDVIMRGAGPAPR
ncbi:MAG: TetR/AcrR family transcriptional regulator [Microbacteriaceae bacterium]